MPLGVHWHAAQVRGRKVYDCRSDSECLPTRSDSRLGDDSRLGCKAKSAVCSLHSRSLQPARSTRQLPTLGTRHATGVVLEIAQCPRRLHCQKPCRRFGCSSNTPQELRCPQCTAAAVPIGATALRERAGFINRAYAHASVYLPVLSWWCQPLGLSTYGLVLCFLEVTKLLSWTRVKAEGKTRATY